MRKKYFAATFSLALAFGVSSALATTINVGVAAGFKPCYLALGEAYDSNNTYGMFSSTDEGGGMTADNMTNLYNDIYDALDEEETSPYELFLSANTGKPDDLQTYFPNDVIGDPFNYAVGALYLWSISSSYDVSEGSIHYSDYVTADGNKYVTCTPYGTYGEAALYVLEKFYSVYDSDDIHSETLMQTVVTNIVNGTYPIGFVGNAQVSDGAGGLNYSSARANSTYYEVPANLYITDLTQAGIEISTGDRLNSTELAYLEGFIDYMQSTAGKTIIANYGYTLP